MIKSSESPNVSIQKHLKIMGVLNITPDSFFDGGEHYLEEKALKRAREMLTEGADIIDIGGESTRPPTSFHCNNGDLEEVDCEQEWQRISFVLSKMIENKGLIKENGNNTVKISVDTRKIAIARRSLELGVDIINLVSSGLTPEWGELLGSYPKSSIIICHMRGEPKAMQTGDFHSGPIIPYLKEWFSEQIALLQSYGVKDSQIMLDPGIGFGKRKPDQDLEILHSLEELKSFGYPIVVGLSRKSFMGVILDKPCENLLNASVIMNTVAALKGADIIRVHDVKEHHELAKLITRMFSYE